MHYTVWQVNPAGYQHSRCFDEVAVCMRDGLRGLGYSAEITKEFPKDKENVIILGAHLLHPEDVKSLCKSIPNGSFRKPIIWQLEQIPGDGEEWRTNTALHASYLEALRNAEVWDYSVVNIEKLKELGIEAKMVPVGYVPALTCIENCENQDISVLHYGSMNKRRQNILDELKHRGLKVVSVHGLYGAARDALIARSKIVLNCHYYESKLFEIVRCSYLLANRKCVVSETGLGMEGFEDGVAFCAYEDIADCVIGLLADDAERERIAAKGFSIFKARPQAAYLRGVLQ